MEAVIPDTASLRLPPSGGDIVSGNAAWTHEQLLDSIKTRLQRDGRATFGAHLTVAELAELAEIASDLGFGLNEIVVSGWGNYATEIAVKR